MTTANHAVQSWRIAVLKVCSHVARLHSKGCLCNFNDLTGLTRVGLCMLALVMSPIGQCPGEPSNVAMYCNHGGHIKGTLHYEIL